MKLEIMDLEYYYCLYFYNLYKIYVEEYGIQIGMGRLSCFYDEYFVEGNDLNQWLFNGKIVEFDVIRLFVIKNKEDNLLGCLLK